MSRYALVSFGGSKGACGWPGVGFGRSSDNPGDRRPAAAGLRSADRSRAGVPLAVHPLAGAGGGPLSQEPSVPAGRPHPGHGLGVLEQLIRHRVVYLASCVVCEPIFECGFIFDRYAKRVGKGAQHRAAVRCNRPRNVRSASCNRNITGNPKNDGTV